MVTGRFGAEDIMSTPLGRMRTVQVEEITKNIKEMYLNQRLSSLDIAKKYNINPSAVCFLLL